METSKNIWPFKIVSILATIIRLLLYALRKIFALLIKLSSKLWTKFAKSPPKVKYSIVLSVLFITIAYTAIAGYFFQRQSSNTVQQTTTYNSDDVVHGVQMMTEDLGTMFSFLEKKSSEWADESQILKNCVRSHKRCRDNAHSQGALETCAADYALCMR